MNTAAAILYLSRRDPRRLRNLMREQLRRPKPEPTARAGCRETKKPPRKGRP